MVDNLYVCLGSDGPEGLPCVIIAAQQRSQVAQGLGTLDAPAHASTFEPLADHAFTRRLDGAGTDLPALLPVGGVVHAVQLVSHIAH